MSRYFITGCLKGFGSCFATADTLYSEQNDEFEESSTQRILCSLPLPLKLFAYFLNYPIAGIPCQAFLDTFPIFKAKSGINVRNFPA